MASSEEGVLVFYCNGNRIIERRPDPEMSLLFFIRKKLGLTGTKQGCAEGGCGSCTVMVSTFDRTSSKISHRAVNACLAPLCSVHGAAVTTVEGIGNTETKLHPVQERIAKAHGSQCGFCTPGMVMSMYTLLRNNPQPTMEEIQLALGGNLCRCTGYRPILQGYKSFSKESCCGGGCQNGREHLNGEDDKSEEPAMLFDPRDFTKYDPSQDLIFPPELVLSADDKQSLLTFKGKRVTWYRPCSLDELLDLKAKFPDAKLINGNTDIGRQIKFQNREYPVLVDVNHISELKKIDITSKGIVVGSSVNLSRLGSVLQDMVGQHQEHARRVTTAISTVLRWFGSTQIRNVVTIGSNIVSGDPNSDLNSIFMAVGCTIELVSTSGSRYVTFDQNFFTEHRGNILTCHEVVKAVTIPFTSENEYIFTFKQSARREFDNAIVNAAMRVEFETTSDAIIRDVALVFGGMSDRTAIASKTMARLKGKCWDSSMLNVALSSLEDDLPLPEGAPGGMEPYRRSLALGFFFKFYLNVLDQLQQHQLSAHSAGVSSQEKSAISLSQHIPVKATQVFQKVPAGQPSNDPVGRPMSHKTAYQQATGEAIYIDDIPTVGGELYMSVVYGRKAHAEILGVDASKALAIEGVVDFVTARDVPGENGFGMINDDQLMATSEIFHACQPIGAILADTQPTARRAAQLVEIKYREMDAIITIEDAIENQSFFDFSRVIEYGDLQEAFEKSDHVIEGEVKIGGQEHFYLETQCALVVPKENQEMEVFVASQQPTDNQTIISKALGVPSNRVICRVKRIGGAFGGKVGDAARLSSIAAVAAKKTGRPVRFMLDRDEDMMSTGLRDPFIGRYKVGCTKEGKLLAADIKFYSNTGYCTDLSPAIMNAAIHQFDNCYKFPTLRIEGILCRTNVTSSTACRGFGAPQGMMVAESIITDVGMKCGISQQQAREINFYKEGDSTPTNQKLEKCQLHRCWEQCLERSDYATRRHNVDIFNRENRWKKRGIAMIPVKFGIAMHPLFFNQAGALVHIYTDGSVLVSSGGIEMGQGLFTKLQQIAARTLGIPESKIHQTDTSTEKVPNTSPTGGSTGADLNGRAVENACSTLRQRLEPFIHDNPKGDWDEWVRAAYFSRVSLSAVGFYKAPNVNYDHAKNEGKLFHYFAYGAGVSEVEIDCLTGDHQTLRTDIVMDVGESLNPAIDVGQIEGAFVQGYGLFVLEDLRWSADGHLLTKGPISYKIPACGNIPAEFNVTLLKDAPNPGNVCSSKAVGEPPLFLSSSVFFAIKDAIMAARADEGLTGVFRLDTPSVAERIRLACVDQFTKRFPVPQPGTFQPYFVRP